MPAIASPLPLHEVSADIIDDFLEYTDGIASPDNFRLWSGISLVAGALERRVWLKTRKGLCYPSLYVFLMAAPGIGKYVIEEVRGLWRETKEATSSSLAFSVAPDSVTKAALIDSLVKSKRTRVVAGTGDALTTHSLLVAAEEFAVLCPFYDIEFMATMNSMFNSKPLHEEARRSGNVREVRMENPLINLLAGYQPALMATTFPEEAWSSGFTRRIIMVYSGDRPYHDLFDEPDNVDVVRQSILQRLSKLSGVYGQCSWDNDAREFIREWDRSGGQPRPKHSKLRHYCQSRTHFVLKLAIVSNFSSVANGHLRLFDFKRAVSWLTEAERVMPDVFRDMIGKSDQAIYEELRYFIISEYQRAGRTPVKRNIVWKFVGARVPSDKIGRLIEAALAADFIALWMGSPDDFIPGMNDGTFGVE